MNAQMISLNLKKVEFCIALCKELLKNRPLYFLRERFGSSAQCGKFMKGNKTMTQVFGINPASGGKMLLRIS